MRTGPLAPAYFTLAVCALAAQDPDPPSVADQQLMLARMADYADQYISHLPNFTCTLTTRQLIAGKHGTHWRENETLTARLSFSEGHERRQLAMVDGRPLAETHKPWRAPLMTEGEFGILLRNVVGSGSASQFGWARWDQLGGRRMAVFHYEIDKEHSTMRLSLSDLARAQLPYRGEIFADASTGVVWRITDTADDIPKSLRTRQIATVIDYDRVVIATREYLLPVRATIQVRTDAEQIRNELTFSAYRKFEVDSTVTFSSETPRSQP